MTHVLLNRFSTKIVWIFAFTTLLFTAVHGQDAADFDFNKNGRIDPGKEAKALLRHTNDKLFAKMDSNKDGTISNEERDDYQTKLDEELAYDLIDIEDQGGMPVARANSTYLLEAQKRKAQEGKPAWLKNLYLRRSHEDIGILKDPKDVKKAEGVLLAYTRDKLDDNDIWQARGAAMYQFRKTTEFAPTSNQGGITAYSFLPSITFDRTTNDNNPDEEVDSLIFRAGTEIEYEGGSRWWHSQHTRFNLAYATDFDFDSAVWALETQWEPLNTDWAMGVSKLILNRSLDVRWRGILHAEAGYVVRDGGNSKLVENDSFFRIGPKLQLDIWPSFSDRLGLGFSWAYLKGVSGTPRNSRMFESDLKYLLTENGNIALSLSYRKGDVPLIQKDVDSVNLGFNIKY